MTAIDGIVEMSYYNYQLIILFIFSIQVWFLEENFFINYFSNPTLYNGNAFSSFYIMTLFPTLW